MKLKVLFCFIFKCFIHSKNILYILGELCEITHIPDQFERDDCVPCQNNFKKYFNCLINRSNSKLIQSDMESWFNDCKLNKSCWEQLNYMDCINNGTCQVTVGQCNFF